MGLPRSIADARPNVRRRFAGALNKPVGGNVRFFDIPRLSDKVEAVDNRDLQERGLTIPITVTAVSQEVFSADNDRKFLFIQNNDPVGIVYVSFGGIAAVLLQGIRLAPNGGGILLDAKVPTSRIHMIGTIANNPNVTATIG